MLSLKQIWGFRLRILRLSIIEFPSCTTLTTNWSLSCSSFFSFSPTTRLAKKWPICGYTLLMVFLSKTELMPWVFSSLRRVTSIASSRSRWRVKSQKQAFRLKPPSISILNPLMPNSAESPWPPGKTYSVGWLNLMLPTTSEGGSRSWIDCGWRKGSR